MIKINHSQRHLWYRQPGMKRTRISWDKVMRLVKDQGEIVVVDPFSGRQEVCIVLGISREKRHRPRKGRTGEYSKRYFRLETLTYHGILCHGWVDVEVC